MVRSAGLHAHFADMEVHCLEFLDGNVGRDVMQADWEKRVLHLAIENLAQTLAGPFVAEDPEAIAGLIQRAKERQPLNVVPMRVAQKQGEPEGAVFELGQ